MNGELIAFYLKSPGWSGTCEATLDWLPKTIMTLRVKNFRNGPRDAGRISIQYSYFSVYLILQIQDLDYVVKITLQFTL